MGVGCTSEPPPTVDVPTSDLDLIVAVLDSASGPSQIFTMQFLLNGKVVRVDPAAHVSCHGFVMEFNGLIYGANVPKVAPGVTLTCIYIYTRLDFGGRQ
jgi:hypothetical protein